METSKSRTAPKHRPLTPLRVIRGVICLVVFVATAFTFLVYLAPPLAVALRCFSLGHFRRATSLVFGLWLALWPFLFEKINGTEVVFSGDRVPSKERVLLISNHRTEVDWMYLWDLALRKGCLGNIKYILKKSLMKLPLLGWGFHVLEFVPLERDWELDEPVLRRMVSSFSHDSRDPLWLVIFPEGTDFTEQKSERSREFAAKFGLPVLTNVLLPKTKGFCACLEELRNSLDAVYDVTIAYKNNCPTFLDNVFGVDPSQVHINIRRIIIDDIPTSETNSGAWLIDAFEHKDKLLSDFKAQGCFPNAVSEKELPFLKCLANSVMIILITIVFIYLTFYSFVCFKIYVCLSCVYFAFATHMNIQPMPFYNYVKRYCD